MPTVHFSHPASTVGSLSIDDGIDDIQWAYNLNTAVFPTYGGEVVQVLSVFIDDITMIGTLSTYAQLEAVYGYFGRFMEVATQGNVANPVTGKTSYNLQPMLLTYPHRNWSFKIFPLTAPKFYYGADVIAPTWTLTAHVIDDSPDLALIKEGIKALIVTEMINGAQPGQGGLTINGEISPDQTNPDTDPFQTYDADLASAQTQIAASADYYNSLLPAYLGGDFSALTGALGSTPASPSAAGDTTPGSPVGATVTIPKVPPTPLPIGHR